MCAPSFLVCACLMACVHTHSLGGTLVVYNIYCMSYVMQGPKTRRLSGIIYEDTSKNRSVGFSSLKFFISAGVRKFVII